MSMPQLPRYTPDGRAVADEEYVSYVRRFKPSSLIPLLAATGSQYANLDQWQESPGKRYAPWVLADIARVSLAMGNEFRADATPGDLFNCCERYLAFIGRELIRNDEGSGARYFLRSATEQFPYQQVDLNHLARSAALFLHTLPVDVMEVIKPGWEETTFGCTLREYIGIGQLVHTAAADNYGTVDMKWFDLPQMDEILEVIPAQLIKDTIRQHYVIHNEDFRGANNQFAQPGDLRRYAYNPLLSTPVIEGFHDMMYVPVPQAVLRKFGTLGLYFSGLQKFGPAFTRDMGLLFEQYVGDNLKLIPGATVLPEITYKTSNGHRKSIDWFVILPEVVLLVEAKSHRPTDPVRLALPETKEQLRRLLGKPLIQLQTTMSLIQAGQPEFAAIPIDRPFLGLAVTLEPFDFANWIGIRDIYRPEMTFPATVISSYDLEHMVCMVGLGPNLASRLSDGDATSSAETAATAFYAAMEAEGEVQNPIIIRGFEAFPWSARGRADSAPS